MSRKWYSQIGYTKETSLLTYKCYSLWIDPKKPNLLESAIATGAEAMQGDVPDYAIDGFYCEAPEYKYEFAFRSVHQPSSWIQVIHFCFRLLGLFLEIEASQHKCINSESISTIACS